MFEVGGKVVIRNSPHYEIFVFQKIQGGRAYLKDSTLCTFSVGLKDLEIATEQEIAAGHRIDLENLRDCDTSPNCKKFDERVK